MNKIDWVPVPILPPQYTPLLVAKWDIVFGGTVLWNGEKFYSPNDDRPCRQDYAHWFDIRKLKSPAQL